MWNDVSNTAEFGGLSRRDRIINDDAKIGSIRHMPCRQIPGIYTQITDYAFPPATKSWSYKAKTPAIV